MWGFKTGAAVTALLIAMLGVTPMASAQDMSPVLLIETGPSDNADYRRMTFTKYIQGNRVTVAYKSYNRSEFKQVRDDTPQELVNRCAGGPATTLRELDAYESAERRAERSGTKPEIKTFCIKNVPNWEGGNRKRYLDPIFNGMPYAKDVN